MDKWCSWYIFYLGSIVSGVIKELTRLLSEMHGTDPEDEKAELLKVMGILREQEMDEKLWLMMMWFTLDQVRIIKHLHELSHDIKNMTDALAAISGMKEENPEHQDSIIDQHI